ncbi:alcohol dehydrogenase 1 [Xylocopa sonorina]|uniref:alcohol dehydrogenase 1 n=1 Tax=Xylocopa sonorina TaxID=1818115 RepID=UPI00403AA94F
MQSRRVTSFFFNLLKKSPRFSRKIECRQFHATSVLRRKKKKSGDDQLKIIKPGNCAPLPTPLLEPSCKNAIVIGGSEGFGFAAADHLLCKGARNVVIADDDPDQGQTAAEKLCNSYGKGRGLFVHYDIKSDCHVQAGLKHALCKLKAVHILFNDLDKERHPSNCPVSTKRENGTAKTLRVGLQLLGRNHGGPGGIIVNCASIFGFMGWPQDPYPIYCKKEPVIEITRDFAEEHSVEETGVRLVALCPTNKQFGDIGLPDFPESIPNKQTDRMPICIPSTKYHIGTALSYVLAWAKNGSTWLVEPVISVHQVPRLIHFPETEGGKVDPKIYQTQVEY